jgi:hypothetical protein
LWLRFSVTDHSGCCHGDQYKTRETSIPDNHDVFSETVGCHHRMDKEVSSMIVQLMEQNWFSKNLCPKRIMSELQLTFLRYGFTQFGVFYWYSVVSFFPPCMVRGTAAL